MPRGGEPTHVAPDLGDDHLRGHVADARHRHESRGCAAKGIEVRAAAVKVRDGPVMPRPSTSEAVN